MQRIFCFLLAAAALAFAAQSAAAQAFQPRTIQFKGAPEYSDRELMAASGLEMGKALTNEDINAHAKRLMDAGVFSNLNYKYDGPDLIFTLTPAEWLIPIRLDNLPLTPGKDLDARLHERFPLYHGKVPPEGGLEESVRGALEELLAAQGIKASVTAGPYTDMKLGKVTAVVYAIVSPPVVVGDIRLDSGSLALDQKAQQILTAQAGAPYSMEGSPNQIATNLGNYYRDQGYLEVAIHADAQSAPVVTPDAVRIPFVVSLAPGPLYKVTSVQMAPGLAVSQADFDRQSGIHPGDVADGVRIRQNWEYVARQYHNHGYIKAAVTPTPTFDRAHGTVSYVVTVEPGPVYAMGSLTIESVSDDLRARMMAAWKIAPGAVFNEGAILGFFATHGVNPELERVFATVNLKYTMRPNDATHVVDLTLRLEKRH